ncbi:unnamed protein product, partial [Sphacelaria rigidula]
MKSSYCHGVQQYDTTAAGSVHIERGACMARAPHICKLLPMSRRVLAFEARLCIIGAGGEGEGVTMHVFHILPYGRGDRVPLGLDFVQRDRYGTLETITDFATRFRIEQVFPRKFN